MERARRGRRAVRRPPRAGWAESAPRKARCMMVVPGVARRKAVVVGRRTMQQQQQHKSSSKGGSEEESGRLAIHVGCGLAGRRSGKRNEQQQLARWRRGGDDL